MSLLLSLKHMFWDILVDILGREIYEMDPPVQIPADTELWIAGWVS